MHDTGTLQALFESTIQDRGGWVNAHVHADRAFTLDEQTLALYRRCSLEQKWDALDSLKYQSTEQDYYRRFCRTIELMIAQGVTAMASFVDIDPVAGDRAIRGAIRAREQYRDQITVLYANQTLKGVIDPQAREWFDRGAAMVDIIGALPRRDERDHQRGSEALDIVMETARSHNKMLHVHVDQFNHADEFETEQLCDKTIEHGMQGRVAAIHGISLGAHAREYRRHLYQKMHTADVMMIACPMAWIDSPRTERPSPTHNALTPIDELLPAGVPVALGTDNISDAMVPFCEGNMWHELKLLSAGCRYMDFEEITRVASEHGRRALGLATGSDPRSARHTNQEDHHAAAAVL